MILKTQNGTQLYVGPTQDFGRYFWNDQRGFLVQRSFRGRGAEMSRKISLLVYGITMTPYSVQKLV